MVHRGTRGMLVVAAVVVGLATPASAYLTDVAPVSFNRISDSTSPQNITLGCPSGKNLLGVGAVTTGADLSQVGIFQLGTIGNDTTGMLAETAETDPFSGNWATSAVGLCAKPTGTAPPEGAAAAYVKSVRAVNHHTGFNSDTKATQAKCPGDRAAIAGGGGISMKNGPNEAVAFDRNGAVVGGEWPVSAHETDSTNADWRVDAVAICANISTETDTSDYAGDVTSFNFNGSGFNSQDVKQISEKCPHGQSVVGGGALIRDDSFGYVGDPDVVITRSEPTQVRHHEARKWTAEATELDPTVLEWKVEAHVVCVRLNGGPPA